MPCATREKWEMSAEGKKSTLAIDDGKSRVRNKEVKIRNKQEDFMTEKI